MQMHGAIDGGDTNVFKKEQEERDCSYQLQTIL